LDNVCFDGDVGNNTIQARPVATKPRLPCKGQAEAEAIRDRFVGVRAQVGRGKPRRMGGLGVVGDLYMI
jgi:hypothetical protein